MITIRYKDQNIDLKPNTQFSMNLVAPQFFEQSGDVIPGSYSFPFELPVTAKNAAILDFPNRIDFAGPFLTAANIELYYDGVFLFYGDMYIKKGGTRKIEAFISVANFSKLEDLYLHEIDYGGRVTLGANLTAALAHAKDTAYNPENYDYIFFPVTNERFFAEILDGPTHDFAKFQNYWDKDASEFISSNQNQAAMPFLKIDFVMRKIFESQGYTFVNNFQTTDELKNIVLYNNYSIYEDEDNWSLVFDPANHVPYLKAKEFIKEVCKIWSCAVIYNVFTNEVTLEPTKNILAAQESKDWTGYLQREYDIVPINSPVNYLEFVLDPNDRTNMSLGIADESDEFDHIVEFNSGPYNEDERYYVYSGDLVDLKTNGATETVQIGLRRLNISDGDQGVTINAQPVESYAPINQVEIFGTAPFYDVEVALSHIRFMTYRGIQDLGDGKDWPYNDNVNYLQQFSRIGDYSNVWMGPYGIYETWWKPWIDFIQSAKQVNAKLDIPVRELLKFKHTDKIRIAGQHYFVKSIQTSLTTGSIVRCEAKLLKTI